MDLSQKFQLMLPNWLSLEINLWVGADKLPSPLPGGLEEHRSPQPCWAPIPMGKDTAALAPGKSTILLLFYTFPKWSCLTAGASEVLGSTEHDMHKTAPPLTAESLFPSPLSEDDLTDQGLQQSWDLLRSHKTWVRLAEKEFLCTEMAFPKAWSMWRIHFSLKK